MAVAHLVERQVRVVGPETDTIEPIAVFSDVGELDYAMLALGFEGSYLVANRFEAGQFVLTRTTPFPRFVTAVAALDAAQREALALTPEKLDALAMLDELRSFYAMGELVNARRLGASCERGLRDAFAVNPTGARRPIVREPATLARITEQALARFLYDPAAALGQVHQILIAAADLGGGPREPHEIREDRARRAAFGSRSTELETIELPFGVVHPTMWPAVAERLGTTLDVARQRLCGGGDDREADDEVPVGPVANADRLEGLLDRLIPIIPESERPALYVPARDRYASDVVIPDPLTEAYAALRNRLQRFARLRELAAPDVIIDNEAMAVQHYVEQLAVAAGRRVDMMTLDGWGEREPARAARLWQPEGEAEASVASVVWLTDDRIAVARDDVASIISLSERRVLRTIVLGGSRLQTCDDTGRLVLTTRNSMNSELGVMQGFGCFDADTGDWLAELPDHLPAVSFGKDQPEDGVLYDHRRNGSVSFDAGDRPTAMAWGRGNRAVWLSADYSDISAYGIVSTLTCFEEVSAKVLQARCAPEMPVLHADGTVAGPEEALDDDRERDMYEAAPCAFACVDGRYTILTPTLHVADLDTTWFQLGFAIDAASFSPDGTQLLVFGDELVVISVTDRAIVWRAALGELSG